MDRAEQVLLSTLSCSTAGERAPRLGPRDWSRLLAMAADTGVAPQLHRHLRPEAVPADLRGRLAAMHQVNAMRSARLRQAATRVVAALTGRGLPCCLLKGAACGETIGGGDWSARFSADLDLLVPEGTEQEAWQALLEAGGVPGPSEDEPHHHLPAVFVEGCPVEVHTALWRPGVGVPLDTADLFRQRRRAGRSSPFHVLSPTHQVLHLCLHMAGSHGFGFGLRSLHQLGMLVLTQREEVDWPALAAGALAGGYTAYLYHPLRAAARLLGAPVPPAALHALRPRGLVAKAAAALAGPAIRQQLLPWRWPRRILPGYFAAHLCQALTKPLPLGRRLAWLLQLVFVPMNWSKATPVRLPAPPGWPYPLWLAARPALLAGRYAGRLLRPRRRPARPALAK